MGNMRIVHDIIEGGRLTNSVVRQLARDVFPEGIQSYEDADLIYRLEAECIEKEPAWNEAYVDWLTGFYIWEAEPSGSVDNVQARHLVSNLLRDGRIAGETELELLLNIVTWAHSCSTDVGHLLMKVVWDSVTGAENAIYGNGRAKGRIDAVDVEILRKGLYAPAAAGGIMVSRTEAEMLFALNNATVDANNHPSWQDFFVGAVANHLMFPRVSPATTTAERCSRLREAWQQQSGGSDILASIERALGGDADAHGIFGPQLKELQDEHMLEEAAIDADEAAWLRGQIAADSRLHDNEVALLRYVKKKSPHVDSSLNALFIAAGIT